MKLQEDIQSKHPFRAFLYRDREMVATVWDGGFVFIWATRKKTGRSKGWSDDEKDLKRNPKILTKEEAWQQTKDAICEALIDQDPELAAVEEPADEADTVPITVDPAPATRGNELAPVAGSFEVPHDPAASDEARVHALDCDLDEDCTCEATVPESPAAPVATPEARATLGRWRSRSRS